MIAAALLFLFTAVGADTVQRYVRTERYRTEVTIFLSTCYRVGYYESGFVWSSCTDGKTVNVGCTSNSGRKYKVGEEFVESGAKWRCERDDKYITLTPVACVMEGEVLEISSVRRSGSFFWTCMKTEQGIRLTVTGCANKDGRMVSLGSKFQKGKFLYECVEELDKVSQRIVGCEVKGRMLKLGERVQSGSFYVECKRTGRSGAMIDIVGCADSSGRMILNGDRMTDQSVVYECSREGGESGSGWTLKPVGCRVQEGGLSKSLEFGQRWATDFKGDMAYTMKCEGKDGSVGSVIVGCIFREPEGIVKLEVGCGQQHGNRLLICKKSGPTSVLARSKSMPKIRMSLDGILDAEGVRTC